MKTNIGNYTDKQILEMVKALPSFRYIPEGYWLAGFSSKEDEADHFDDKFYLFKGSKFIKVTSGTTNPGKYGLLNFKDYGAKGCAVIKTNEWYYDLWSPGLHKGRMRALKQVNNVKYYRDSNMNLKSDESGELYTGIIGLNFHSVTYETKPSIYNKIVGLLIGKWSTACQVANVVSDYFYIIDLVWNQKFISYCILKEK